MRRIRVNNVDGALKQIMVLNDPTTSANNTGGVIAAHHEGKIFICVHGGFSLEIGSLCEVLSIFPLIHYILHIEMPCEISRPGYGCYGQGRKVLQTQHELISKYTR